MHTAVAIGEIFKGKSSPEKKDKIEEIKGENYSLYFLFDGCFSLPNTSRAIAISLKFVRSNFKKYEKAKSFELAKMMNDIHKGILELGISNPHTAYAAAFVPQEVEQDAKVSWLGEVGVFAVSNKSLITLSSQKPNVEKLLGSIKTKSGDFREAILHNKKNGILLASDGFANFMEGKTKDFVRILNNAKLMGVKTAVNRFVKNRTFQDATYIYIRR